MKYYTSLVIFLIINFAALGIGSLLMGDGPTGSWYSNLDKAPWTPPGWVFGVAWTTIMICFAIYMAQLTKVNTSRSVLILFGVQLFLNVIWNYIFFNQHLVLVGLVEIVLLLGVVGYFLFAYWSDLKGYSLLIAPYFVWLIIAASLNGYVWWYN